jgi:large subunit ribosomal protein L18
MANHRNFDRKQKRDWRRVRISKRIEGSAEKPRLCVYKSRKYIYVQAVDDVAGVTVAQASSLEPALKGELKTSGKHVSVAQKLGLLISERLKAKGIEKAVFDRGGYLYHGRVKSLAEGARKGGLQF